MSNSNDDPNAIMVTLVGAIGIVAVGLAVVGLQALYYSGKHKEIDRKSDRSFNADLLDQQSKQYEMLHTWRWVDQGNGVVAIPIDHAIELTAEELAGRTTAGATKAERGNTP